MSKRFIDSDLWTRDWFLALAPAEKCAFVYLTTQCDAVGVWKPNYKLAEYQIGVAVDWTALRQAANGNIEVLPNGKWWLPDFVRFQYGKLRAGFKLHQTYVTLLEKHGLVERCEALVRGTEYPLDTDKKQTRLDTEEEQDKTPDHRVHDLVCYYAAKYEQKTGSKPTVTGQWGATFKRLLRAHTDDELRRVVDYFFAYDKRTRFGFGAFTATFDNIVPAATGHAARASPYKKALCPHCGRVLDEGHAPDCPVLTRGNDG